MIRLGIDIGGTFTDLVAMDETGAVRTHKIASAPGDYAGPILAGIAALGLADPAAIGDLRHATTLGSNTVLEGKGARTALITTAGFRDILEIRDLRMPVLYDMRWTKPAPLVARRHRFTVIEKLRPDGSVAIPLDPASLDAAITAIAAAGIESVAVALLHSYANPAHEQAVAQALAARLPGLAISVSHAILPEIKEYPRTSTTVVNAYVQPAIRAYLTVLTARLAAMGITARLRLMQSHGGLAGADFAARQPARIVESGPAAGVVGGAAVARALGEGLLITFDMGGTTAKAGLVEQGEVLRAEALEIGAGVLSGARLLVGAGYMLKLPAIDLAEVGAGGGSLCRLDAAGAPKIGPESAGADPGPVCYGRGGSVPTITDCNLALGYLDPAGLAGGALALDAAAARAAIARDLAGPLGLTVEEAAAGMLRLAASSMMRAIRAVSVERGRDARAAALLAFGGNGPLFATAIAEALGIARVLIPPLPGLFSALGLLLAAPEHHASRSLRLRLDPAGAPADATALRAALAEL
ncbi:MAG: hydantoinase/oxoprolinase family protein, partial [Rhodospirillales bacterium]|nr:hydantoinase/oxoprolinase family protein [Rhodospirillales bacterium]